MNTIKLLFLFAGLFGISIQASAICSYGGGSGGGSTASFSTILADSTVPNGTILATTRIGNLKPKTFMSCTPTDVYVVRTVPYVTPSAIRKIDGKPVYETGIPGIGFQISDITKPKGRFYPADIDNPVPASSSYYSSSSGQAYVWLIKTGPITKTSLSEFITVHYMAGSTIETASGASNKSELYRININLKDLSFKETTCDITPKGGNIIRLQNIELSALNSLFAGQVSGKQKEFSLDIKCPVEEVDKNYLYWFNPISQTLASADGVLLNSLADGALNAGIIIKKGTTPIKFNSLTDYTFKSAQSQEIKFTADYYKVANPVTLGTTGDIKVDFEIVLQER